VSNTLALATVTTRRGDRPSERDSALHPTAIMAAGAVAALTFVVYLLTLAPDLYSLDSPELAAAAYRLGIAHEPGYPLYTLLGWLFSHAFPVSNVAYRLNVLSALFGVAACVATFTLASRLVRRPVAAAAGALALGFSYYFWADALAAEVYTLDAALYAGLLLAACVWRAQRTPASAAAVGLLFGLGMATRTTTLLYLPALAVFAWVSGERSPGAWAAAAAGVCAGTAFYLYLPLRSAAGIGVGPGYYTSDGALHVWNLASWSGFWNHVTAARFQGDAFAYGPVGAVRQAGVFGGQLAGSFLVVGLFAAAAGIARQWRADRALLLLVAGTAAPVTIFFINYGTLDKEFMFLPAYVACAVWIALGIEAALDRAEAYEPSLRGSAMVAAAPLLLPLAALVVNLPLVSLHGEHRPRAQAQDFLARVPQGAIVYGPFLDIAPFQYLQEVEHSRTDLALVNAWTIDERTLLALADANVGSRPFFITQDEPVLHKKYQLVRVGTGYEVRPQGR